MSGVIHQCVEGRSYCAGMAWYPLSKRDEVGEREEYDALHEGVPEWLSAPAGAWVESVFEARRRQDLVEAVDVLCAMLRRPMPSGHNRTGEAIFAMRLDVEAGDLDVLDAVVWSTAVLENGSTLRGQLDLLFRSSGSVWTIGRNEVDQPCLERRVDETVVSVAKAEMAEQSNAAAHLHRAWHRIYGRSPDPGGAYREAIRAVEAAVKPVIGPNDSVFTLGKGIASMKDKPEKWKAILDGTGDGAGMGHVIGMCQALWTSQLDRHGTDDESVPLDVSAEEAEAAVVLAVTLVHWFRSGAVQAV